MLELGRKSLPVYDNDVSKVVVCFKQFNTFPNAHARRDHIHIENTFEIFRFALCKSAIQMANALVNLFVRF